MNAAALAHQFRRRGAGLVLLALASIALAACGSAPGRSSQPDRGQPSQSNAPAKSAYHGALVNPPIPKPEFTLTDTSESRFDFQQATQNNVTLLYFGYTHCPDVCPTQMATIATALKQMPAGAASHVTVVFVTTDPARDTPEVLQQWLGHFDQRFIGLTGSQAAVETAERVTGVPAAQQEAIGNGDYGVDHAGFVIAYTPDNLAHIIYPDGVTPDAWAQDLTKLVSQGWPGA